MKKITVRKKCDECNGELISTGNGTGNNWGSAWAHECTKCKKLTMIFEKSYPIEFIEYEENEKEERWE